MKLLKHLQEKFPAGGEWKEETLVAHFMEHFGVNAKVEHGPEGDYWQFKYGMIEAKWTTITRECRGSILHVGEEWQVLARPFDKFFNRHEGSSGISTEKQFAARAKDLCFVEKADGTCIEMWWDPFKKAWRAATLGAITNTAVVEYGGQDTFDSLFWETLPEKMLDQCSHGTTYLFELCCKQNRILTRYKKNCIFLIGARRIEDGELLDSETLTLMATKAGIELPKRISLKSLGITDSEQAIDWVEEQAKSDQYGEYPEGFVLYDDRGPVCKMKNTTYVALYHATGIGSPAHSLSCAIDSFWRGSYDDIKHVLEDDVKEHIERMGQWIRDKAAEAQECTLKLAALDLPDDRAGKRAYAAAVEELRGDKNLTSFLFTHREQIADPNIHTVFVEWLKHEFKRKPVVALRFWKSI